MRKKYTSCPHGDCKYRLAPSSVHECNYAVETGHCRIKGLTLAQARDKTHCPVYERDPGKRARKPRQASPYGRAKYDWVRGMELYATGATDKEIGAALGCTPDAVRDWRYREGLPVHSAKERKARREMEAWEAITG